MTRGQRAEGRAHDRTQPARIPPAGSANSAPSTGSSPSSAPGRSAPRGSPCFTVIGQHHLLFLAWLPFCGVLLGLAASCPRQDAELVILRVGHLRNCEYELQQHRRLARSRGLDAETQARIFEGPDAEGLTDRQRVLITATDEFVITRSMSPRDVGGDVRRISTASS